MSSWLTDLGRQYKEEIAAFTPPMVLDETGMVLQVGDGIARVSGLKQAMSGELLAFEGGVFGIALNLDAESIGAALLGNDASVREGSYVRLTGRVAEVAVGEALIGRVVDALGQPLDAKGPLLTDTFRPIERVAPGVHQRREVDHPLQTGIKAIDAMVPIGRGQRELIIGDRQTGKTTLCLDTIQNQKGTGVRCIYVAIGQKVSTVARTVKLLEESGAMSYTTVVIASAADPVPMQYIAPYSGCSMGEFWMEQGLDVLIVYDDLSKHAVAYRALSLLLQRPPGREAYPGDVFYLHSRLLERAACLSEEEGGGSLTALPIVETQAGNIAAYIPTNIISITDGQIYLEPELFHHGIRPAINPGFSVSRVGGSAQIAAMRRLAGTLRMELAQYRELEAFSQFGSDLNPDSLERLHHGQRIVEVFKQQQNTPLPIEDQVIILFLLTRRLLRDIPLERIAEIERSFLHELRITHRELCEKIQRTGRLEAAEEDIITETFMHFC